MKKESFAGFDVADYLKTEEDIAAYLEAASAEGDPQVLAVAMGDVVRARNVSQIARDAGLTREGVYKALSVEGNPSFATVVKIAGALQLEVAFRPRSKRVTAKSASTASRTRAARLKLDNRVSNPRGDANRKRKPR